MPTVYVKTTLQLNTKRRNWKEASDETKDLWRETAENPVGYRLVFQLNDQSDACGSTSTMRPDSANFAPYDQFQSKLDENTGMLSTTFDGVIKLPITSEADAALRAWPKEKHTRIFVEVSDVFNDASFDRVAVSFPCSISRSKPKNVNFA